MMERGLVNHLKTYRERRGLSQAELAERLGVGQQTVSHWEIGDRVPSIYWALRLAVVLECPVDALFVLPDLSSHTPTLPVVE